MILLNHLPEQFPPDLSLSVEQIGRLSHLTSSEVERIDKALMSHAMLQWRKVAFLAGSALLQMQSEIPNVPDTFYILRIQQLVESGRLEIDGHMNNWRESEVRLPAVGIE